MFYLIKNTYIGADKYENDDKLDASTIEICTSPVVARSFGDWDISSYGEYQTIEEARAAIAEKFGEVRDCDENGDAFESDEDDESVVAIFKPGKYAQMTSQATADWAFDWIKRDIKADTTDERIAELLIDYEDEANSHGSTLHSDLEDFMLERRGELRKEKEEEED